MATAKPKTNVKRATTSRSVRVAKKKQGVTEKQGLVAVALLALIGVVVVVASQAATRPNNVYIKVAQTGSNGSKDIVHRIATDTSVATSYGAPFTDDTLSLSRDKLMLITKKGNSKIDALSSSNGKVVSSTTCVPNIYNCYTGLGDLTWLPGNERVAYTDGYPNSSIGVMNIKNTFNKKTIVPSNGNLYRCLTVQKGGKKLLYTEEKSNTYTKIVSVNLDGTERRVLATTGAIGYGYCPSWSKDDRKISYYTESNAVDPSTGYSVNDWVRLNVMNADGSGVRTLVDIGRSSTVSNAKLIAGSAWSSGSSSVLFVKEVAGVVNLNYVNVGTKKVTKITSNTDKTTMVREYGWSSDGYIVYAIGKRYDTPAAGTINVVKSIKPGTSSAPKTLLQVPSGSFIKDITF